MYFSGKSKTSSLCWVWCSLWVLLPGVFAAERGTVDAPIIDSAMTREQALAGLPVDCPDEIKQRQTLVEVLYYAFDGNVHQGQVMVDRSVAADVRAVFSVVLRERFPLASVIPLADERFCWSDSASMRENNTSSFNYRAMTGATHLSQHALGRAIDINPRLNPYCKDTLVLPEGAQYDPEQPGTLTAAHPVVQAFLARGWTWGGNWGSIKDYQHFEKQADSTPGVDNGEDGGNG